MNISNREAVITISERILNLKRSRDEIQQSLIKAENALRAANEELDDILVSLSKSGTENATLLFQTKSVVPSPGSNGNGKYRAANKELLEYIASNPIVDYAKAAVIVYGKDTKAHRDNVGAKLYYLKKLGLVTKGGNRNEWRIANTPQDEGAGSVQ